MKDKSLPLDDRPIIKGSLSVTTLEEIAKAGSAIKTETLLTLLKHLKETDQIEEEILFNILKSLKKANKIETEDLIPYSSNIDGKNIPTEFSRIREAINDERKYIVASAVFRTRQGSLTYVQCENTLAVLYFLIGVKVFNEIYPNQPIIILWNPLLKQNINTDNSFNKDQLKLTEQEQTPVAPGKNSKKLKMH